MDNAVIIIVGAGAVLDFDHRGIITTVNNITEEVLKLSVPAGELEPYIPYSYPGADTHRNRITGVSVEAERSC